MAGVLDPSRIQKVLAALLIAALALSFTTAYGQSNPTQTSTPVLAQTTRQIDVYNGPGTGYPRIATLPSNTEIQVVAVFGDGTWLYVTMTDASGDVFPGWIRFAPSALQLSLAELETLPMIGTPTPTPIPSIPPTFTASPTALATVTVLASATATGTATEAAAQTTASATQSAAPTHTPTSAVVQAFQPFLRANRPTDVHTEPDGASAVLQTLTRDMTATVVGTSSDRLWLQVALANDVLGWVAADPAFVSVFGDTASLPVIGGDVEAPTATEAAIEATAEATYERASTAEATATTEATDESASTAEATAEAPSTAVVLVVTEAATQTLVVTETPTEARDVIATAFPVLSETQTLPPTATLTTLPTGTLPPTATLTMLPTGTLPPSATPTSGTPEPTAIKPTTEGGAGGEQIGIVAGNNQPKVLRTAPSTESDMILLVRRGTRVEIIAVKEGLEAFPNLPWYNVRLPDGTMGWLRSDTVTLLGTPTPAVVEPTAEPGTATATFTPGAPPTSTPAPEVNWSAGALLVVINPDGVWLRDQPASDTINATLANNNVVTATGNFQFVVGQWWWEVRAEWGATGWVEQTSLGQP